MNIAKHQLIDHNAPAPVLAPATPARKLQQLIYTARPCRAHRKRSSLSQVVYAKKDISSNDDDVWRQLSKMADKYIVGTSPPARQSSGPFKSDLPVQGIHLLLTILAITWLITNSSALPAVSLKSLSLGHSADKWWTPLTDAFVSSSGAVLVRNLFFGYMFGRVVENSESTGALWVTYLVSAVGGSAAAWLLLPKRAPIEGCANTAAIFGLCCMSLVFNRRKLWHWHRLFELAVVLPFVCQQLLLGHVGISQWWIVYGSKAGLWVPLIGGFFGAAGAATVLVLFRAVLAAAAAQQQQQQQQAAGGAASGAGVSPPGARSAEDSLSVLLTKALTQMLKRVL